MSDRIELSRRQAIGVAGAAGVALVVGCGNGRSARSADRAVHEADASTCVLTPEKTEGPYFVDERLNRSDVRGGQAGVKLALTMHVFDASGDCPPVKGALVDIWHANADGEYSDVGANSGERWLRGHQVSDAGGRVRFTTIWPGWYPGRAVHIHFKVRVPGSDAIEFTSQLFFTDAMNNEVFQKAPYSSRGTPDTTDGSDSIYNPNGKALTLHPESGAGGSGGYRADFSVGLSGGSDDEPGDSGDVVDAVLKSKRMVRTATGRRRLRLRVENGERVTARARLTREGRVLTSRKRTLSPGTHRLTLDIPQSVAAGAASLRLVLTDADANKKTVRRAVHVRERNP
jgi:protocatechuate 3,4-dioxygenase beta subunit